MKKLLNLLVLLIISSVAFAQDTINEIMPQFPGGEAAFQQYLRNNIVYPDSAIDLEQEGTVYVYFEIDTAGNIGNVYAKKKILGAPYLDREAVRVIAAMPNWIPGKLNGKSVKVSMTVPVKFVLTDEDVKRRKKEKRQKK